MSRHPGQPTDDEQDAAAEAFYAPPDDSLSHIRNEVMDVLNERVEWYRDGCEGLEDRQVYYASGDCARDAASDLETALSEIRVLESVIAKLRSHRAPCAFCGHGGRNPADEEMRHHAFNSRTPYEPGDDRDIWCKDCEYHRDHLVHQEA